jgi:hypothetical protein
MTNTRAARHQKTQYRPRDKIKEDDSFLHFFLTQDSSLKTSLINNHSDLSRTSRPRNAKSSMEEIITSHLESEKGVNAMIHSFLSHSEGKSGLVRSYSTTRRFCLLDIRTGRARAIVIVRVPYGQ